MKFLKKINFHLNLEGIRKEIPDSFQRELNYQSNRLLNFALLFSLAWLPYIPLDLQLHPDEPMIIVFRIGFPIFGLIMYLLRMLPRFKDKGLLFLTLFAAYLEVMTGIVTAFSKGDSVYIGGYLFILTLLAAVPIRRKHAYLILSLSLLSFFFIGFLKGMEFIGPRGRYSLNDILATAAVASCFIYILDAIRFASWSKSLELEKNRIVISNHNLQLQSEINLAGELQSKLLPHNIPVIENLSIAYRYQPMMSVGGDFVDIIYSSEKNGIGLFVCDVSGHGVAAAFISSMVKMTLSKWADLIDSPSEMLTHLFNSMKNKMGSNFITVSICYIDLEKSKLITANAGHPPTIIARKDGKIEEIRPKGGIIANIVDNAVFDQSEDDLYDGDKVILYTDGIVEAADADNKLFGDEKFFSFIQKNINFSPEELCQYVLDEILEYEAGKPSQDDITILTVEYGSKTAIN